MGNKSRYKSSSIFDMQFITSSISTTLVLLLLGLVVFFVLTAHNLSVYVRENISFSILISDDMKEADILKLQKKLNQEPFVKQSEYISKKQALKEQTEAMGTDPEEFLGYNPFTASIEIKLQLAPTSFIVWMRKRLEYIASLIVLFIKAKEIKVSTTAKASNTRLIFRMLSFTASISSFR